MHATHSQLRQTQRRTQAEAQHTQGICAHTPAPSQTRPRSRRHTQAHAGTCMHTRSRLWSTAPQRSALPRMVIPRCSPKVQPPEQARAVWLTGVAGRGPSQGSLGKPWGRLPPRARVSLPFKKPARGGGGCKGGPANGSCAPQETCRREPERVTEPVPTDRRTEGQTATEAHSLPPTSPGPRTPAAARCAAPAAGHWRILRRDPRARVPSVPCRRPTSERAAETRASAGSGALPAGPGQPCQECRPTMLLLSPRSALLSVYCPQIFLILSSGSYL